jgi:nucleotide-binding universal stress UspA family protein
MLIRQGPDSPSTPMASPVFLVPLDGSDATEAALERAAVTLSLLPDIEVRLLAALDPAFLEIPHETLAGMDLEPSEDEVYESIPHAQKVMDRATAALRRGGYTRTPERIYRTGKPYEVILSEAKRADFLIMHRLDHQGITERLRGSMVEKLARHVACHVWLVDPTAPRQT